MGESEALNAISKGSVIIPCTDHIGLTERVSFKVIKEPVGSCEGCYFNEHPTYHTCPSLARKICCTSGYILKEKK